MALIDDVLKKRKAGAGSNSSENTLDRVLIERGLKRGNDPHVSAYDKWITDVENYNNTLTKDAMARAGKWQNDFASYVENQNSEITRLREEGTRLGDYFSKYSDIYEPYYSGIGKKVSDAVGTGNAWLDELYSTLLEEQNAYSQYASEEEYQKALADYKKAEALRSRYEAYDREAGQAEIDEMKADLDSLPQYNSGDDINLYNAQMRDAILALSQKYEKKSASPTAGMEKEQNRFESAGNALGYLDTILSRNDLQKMLNEKIEFHSAYEDWVEDEKIYSNTLPDFEKYYSVGKNADVESVGKMNTEYMYGMNGQPIGYDAPDNTRVAALALAAHNGQDIGRWAEDKDVKNYLDEMTDDEFDRLSYYIGKDQVEGTNLTERYLFALERHINKRKGQDIFSKIEGKYFLEKLYGGIVGLDGFVQGIKGLASDEKSNATAIQYAGQMIREDLKNDTLKYYNFATGKWNRVEIFGSSTGQVIYDNMVSTGNMLPSIAVSALVEAMLPTVGEGGAVFAGLTASQIGAGAGAVVLGASAAGNAKQEMINIGYDTDTANAYGTMVGLSEAGLSYLMSGIPGIKGSDGAFSALGKKVVTKVDHAMAKVAITLGADMLDEGVEEGLQTVLEAWFKGIATNTDWDAPGIDEVLYSSLLGMLTSAGFGGGRLVVSKTADTIGLAYTGHKLKKSGKDSALIEKGFGLENTKAGDIAASLRKKADAGKRVSNIKLGMLSRNLSESQISAAIQSELGEGSRDLADSISDIIKGKAVSDKSIKAILQNEKALSILNDTLGTSIKAEDSVSAVRKAVSGAIGATEAKQGREREFDRENVVKSLSANLDANNVEAYADTIVSLADGEMVSDREITAVLNNKYARNALNKYLGKSFKEGATANDVRAALVEGDFSRKGQAILYGTTLGIGGNGLKGLVSVVNNSRADASQIAQAYNAIYQAAKGGKGIHDVKNAYLDTLTPAQRNMAYEYGVMDSLTKPTEELDTEWESKETDSVDEKVDESVAEKTSQKETITPVEKLTKEQQKIVDAGKKIGINVVVADIKKGKENIDGLFNGKTLYVNPNPNSGDPMITILKHELTHFTEKSGKWGDFMYSVTGTKAFDKWLKDKGFNNSQEYITDIIEKYKKIGKDLTKDNGAQKEMVANFVGDTLFSNGDSLNRFVEELNAEQKRTFRDFLRDLIEWFKKAFGNGEARDEIAMLERKYGELFRDARETATKSDITAEKYVAETKDTQYNYTFAEEHKKRLEGKITASSTIPLETLMERYDKILEIWNRLGGQLDSKFLNEWNSKQDKDWAFTIFKAQSGYKYNIELSSMCKKGVPLFEAIDTIVKSEAMKELKVDKLGKAEKEILYDLLKSDGFDIPCAICYVEQARQREGVIIDAFLNGAEDGKVGWNQVLRECEEKMRASGVDYKFPALDRSVATDKYVARKLTMTETEQNAFYEALKGIANREIKKYNDSHQSDKKFKPRKLVTSLTPDAIADCFKGNISADLKIYKVLFQNPDSRFAIDKDLLYASTTTHNLAYSHQALYSLFNQQGGVSGYKTKQGNVVYWGDILDKKWEASKLRKEGGIRYQSNSDSQMYTLLDQVQMFIDLTAKGYYLQSYSKVLSYLKLLGLSKGKINASLIPKVVVYRDANGDVDVAKTQENAGLDENGNPIYDDFEGINHAEAFMLLSDPEYSKNVGGVCIGYSDNHIRALLDDSRIQLIIGFHDKTNNPDKRYRGARYSKNYNGINEAVDSEGKTVHIGFNQFVQQAEKMFTKSGENFTGTATYNGKEYKANDIPRLAADLYLEMCAKKGYKPAYNIEGIVDHPNYYKLLADFSLYDSKGNYAPHQKVEYNMPDQVPYLDENGHKRWMKSERYIKNELEKELKVRDDISAKLADKSDDGLIPKFIKAVNEQAGTSSGTSETQLSYAPSENGVDNGSDGEYNDVTQYAYNSPVSIGGYTYTWRDYTRYGWVRAHNVINAGYWKNFTENFANAVTKNAKYPKNKKGEFMIEVYDAYSYSGVTDVIVFATGTIESPNISKIVKINSSDSDLIEEARREVYEIERRGVQCKAGKILDIYNKADIVWAGIGRAHGKEDARYHNRLNTKRDPSEIKANRIVEFHVNEKDNTITIVYDNGEVVTEKMADESDTSYSYTPPKSETFDELLSQHKRGLITDEEFKEGLFPQKPTDPLSLINTKPEDFGTTPDVKKKTGTFDGDGTRDTIIAKGRSTIFNTAFKNDVSSDDYIQKYMTITNKETLKAAAKELDEGGHDGVQKWYALKPERASTIDIVKGFIMLDRYQRAGNIDGAVRVAQKLSEMGTAAGQSVQAFSILRRMTPATMMAYAQKSLDRVREEYIKTKSKSWINKHADRLRLTDDDINYIFNRTLYVATLPDGRDKDVAIAQIAQRLQDKLPPEKGQGIKAAQRISMLLNPKTIGRNILGNATVTSIFWVSDWIGTGADKLLAIKTGLRTKSAVSDVKEDAKAFIRGAYESYDDFVKKINTQIDLDRFDISKAQGKSFYEGGKLAAVAKVANAMDRMTSFFLQVGDRPFYEYWFTRSLNSQIRANKVTVPTPEMIEIATAEALERTWQDNNNVTKMVRQIKDGLNNIQIGGYGVGDVFIKFTKTPANLAKAIFEFSPVGYTTAARDAVKFVQAVKNGRGVAVAQRKFVQSLSNATAGTMLYLIAAGLFNAGLLVGGADEDDDVAAFEKWIQGIPAYSVNIGGKWISYEWMQPIGSIAAIVSDYMEGREEGRGIGNSITEALRAGGSILFEQSFMKSFQTFFTADNPLDGFMEAMFDEPSVFVPQIISQLASATDDTRRTTFDNSSKLKTALNSVLYKIPGLRQTLTEDVDVFGRTVPNSQGNFWDAFMNPANTYTDTSDEVTNHVYALYKNLGYAKMIPPKAPYSIEVGGKKYPLTAEERAEYQMVMGTVAHKLIGYLIANDLYNSYTDEEKANVIKAVYSYADKVAKSQYKVDYTFEMAHDDDPYITRAKFDAMTDEEKQALYSKNTLSSYAEILNTTEEGAVLYFANAGARAAVIHATTEYNGAQAAEIIARAKANAKEYGGEDEEKATVSSFKAAITNHWKPFYKVAYYEGDRDTMNKIKETLLDTGLYSNYELNKKLNDWQKAQRLD